MEYYQPKTEPGLGSTDHKNLNDMSTHQLVSVLRIAFLTEDFDRVEEVLVKRDKTLQTKILYLQEMVELEKLTRLQAEEDLRNRGKRAQDNYENLLKEVKKNNNLADRHIIVELRMKNNELELEVSKLKKSKEQWVDDSNALAQLRIRVNVLENDNNTLRVKINELDKSMKKNSEALADPWITSIEDRVEENVGDYKMDNDTEELYYLERNEPARKRTKSAQGALSVITHTRGAKVDAAARHEHIVEERQENDNVHMSEEINIVVPPSDGQEQKETQSKAKRKMFAFKASFNSFDNFHFISTVHQERYSKFVAKKKFVLERNFQLEGDEFSDIQAMIVSRGWVELTSFAKEASTKLAKEFFANAYQDPAKEDGYNKNDLTKFTSFVRGKKVSFDDKTINQLFGLENYEHCSFEARMAKGSDINHQEIFSTLCRPEVDWVRSKDGTPRFLRTSDLTPIAKAWATFVLHTLLSCSNRSEVTIQKATLLAVIVKGEPVNVGRILADSLWDTVNCSSPASYINHASLISKICERVGVYSEKNEEMVKPRGPITVKWIEKHSHVAYK